MRKHSHAACTSVMVGKKASMDGVNYIARNEDNFVANWPKRFFVQPGVSDRHETYTSPYNKLSVELPERGYRYTSSPDANQTEGWYEEDGINLSGSEGQVHWFAEGHSDLSVCHEAHIYI